MDSRSWETAGQQKGVSLIWGPDQHMVEFKGRCRSFAKLRMVAWDIPIHDLSCGNGERSFLETEPEVVEHSGFNWSHRPEPAYDAG